MASDPQNSESDLKMLTLWRELNSHKLSDFSVQRNVSSLEKPVKRDDSCLLSSRGFVVNLVPQVPDIWFLCSSLQTGKSSCRNREQPCAGSMCAENSWTSNSFVGSDLSLPPHENKLFTNINPRALVGVGSEKKIFSLSSLILFSLSGCIQSLCCYPGISFNISTKSIRRCGQPGLFSLSGCGLIEKAIPGINQAFPNWEMCTAAKINTSVWWSLTQHQTSLLKTQHGPGARQHPANSTKPQGRGASSHLGLT